jgi:hypothetical protein
MAMSENPWAPRQLAQAYCSTTGAACNNGEPRTNATDALYICLCNGIKDKIGTDLDLLAGCQSCLVTGPDYRGRCRTPTYYDGCEAW